MKNWSQLKGQMATYCAAVEAVDTAHCTVAEPEELQNIWHCIVLGEYIESNTKVTTGAISLEVIDCFNKHPFLSHIFNDQAKETTNAKLVKEICEATVASVLEEQHLPSYSEGCVWLDGGKGNLVSVQQCHGRNWWRNTLWGPVSKGDSSHC
jgi:hypothetical protein